MSPEQKEQYESFLSSQLIIRQTERWRRHKAY